MGRHKNRCLYCLRLTRNELSALHEFLSGFDSLPEQLYKFRERAITLNKYVSTVEEARVLWGQYSTLCHNRISEKYRAEFPLEDKMILKDEDILEDIPEISG